MPPIRSSHDDKENHRPAGGSASPPSSRRGRRPAHADRAARERRQVRSEGAPRSIARRVAQAQRDVDAARATAAEHFSGGGSVLDMPRENWVDILQRMRVGLQNSTIGAHVPLPPPALQEGAMDELISGFDTMDLDDATTPAASGGPDGESRRRRIQTKRDLTDLTAELRRLQF